MVNIINTEGKVIFKSELAGQFHEGLCRVKNAGKWGCIDTIGKIVIPCQYDDLYDFNHGVAVVGEKGQYGLINKQNKTIIPFVYNRSEDVPTPHDGKIVYLEKNDNFYNSLVFDTDGNVLLKADGLSLQEFYGDVCKAWKSFSSSENGILSITGNWVVPLGKYEIYDPMFENGVICVRQNGKYGYINNRGDIVVPLIYDSIYDPYQSRGIIENVIVYVTIGDMHGYIDKRNGKEIVPIGRNIPSTYINVHHLRDKMIVSPEGGFIYNIEECKVFVLKKNLTVWRYSEGLCAILKDGKLGFVDKNLNRVIPYKFDTHEDAFYGAEFHNGICGIDQHIIDRQGNILYSSPGRYPAYRFDDIGIGLVESRNLHNMKLINNKGKVVFSGWAIELYTVEGEDLIPVKKENNIDSKWGFIDKKGKLVIPYQFQEPHHFKNGFASIDEPVYASSSSRTTDRIKINNTSIKKEENSGCWTVSLVLLIVAAIAAGVYWYIQNQESGNNSNLYPTETEPKPVASPIDETPAETVEGEEVYEEHYAYSEQRYIQSIVEEYTQAVANNDFATLENLYAPQVSRYINENYLSRDDVLAHHRRYDEYFQVYGKHSSVRWNTLDIRQFAEDKWYVEYIEDFTLDRYDPSLYSVFVRKMGLILNENYKIVNVEEEILEKGYQE